MDNKLTLERLYIQSVDRERCRRGIPLSSLSGRLDVSTNMIYKIVNRGNCRLSTFLRLCDALNLTVQITDPEGKNIIGG